VILSRSPSVSIDNPSIDDISSNDENHIKPDSPSPLPTTTTSPPLPGLSSSLSELDPMLNNRPRTPSPIPALVTDEQIKTETTNEQIMTNSTEDRASLTDTIENQPPIIEKQTSVSVEDSINISDKNEPSLSISTNSGLNDSSTDIPNGDLFQLIEEDVLDLP